MLHETILMVKSLMYKKHFLFFFFSFYLGKDWAKELLILILGFICWFFFLFL